MKKFLIEVPHEPNKTACEHAIQIFLQSGSHYLTRAEWGCMDGEHKSWIMVEVENKEEARLIIPPLFRHEAKIIQLATLSSMDIKEAEKLHSL